MIGSRADGASTNAASDGDDGDRFVAVVSPEVTVANGNFTAGLSNWTILKHGDNPGADLMPDRVNVSAAAVLYLVPPKKYLDFDLSLLFN